MTDLAGQTETPAGASNKRDGATAVAARGILGDRRFLVAAAVLGIAWCGWSTTISALKWSWAKYPVFWAADTTVSEDFRLTSLPDHFGTTVIEGQTTPRYVLAGTGRAARNSQSRPRPDGTPEGEQILPKDTLAIMGVGTDIDKARYPERCSNWYVSRYYVDISRMDATGRRGLPFAVWALDISYYTGGLDTVPHVPERCLQAGGATLVGGSKSVEFTVPAGLDWSKLQTNRVRYETKLRDTNLREQFVQYYTFSLNGHNEPSWEKVRLHLAASPWEKYCYFAKIQFAPCDPGTSDSEADKAAQDFVTNFLPDVLKALPSARQVDTLNNSRKTGKR